MRCPSAIMLPWLQILQRAGRSKGWQLARPNPQALGTSSLIRSRCGLYGHSNLSWAHDEELGRKRLLTVSEVEDGELAVGKEKVVGNDNHEDLIAANTPYVALLKACSLKKDLDQGTRLHADILKRGLLDKNPYIASTLVSMYAKCGALGKAQQVLHKLPVRDVVTWNALIAAYAQQGQGEEALKCYEWMQSEGLSPNMVTFACILKACGSIGAVDKGKQIHDDILTQGLLGKHIVLGNALVDMYAKCGELAQAHRVLDELPIRDVVTWNALIAGYSQQGQGEEALNCYEWMQREGLSPDAVTFVCVLKACGNIGAADKGKQIHDEISSQSLMEKNIVLGNALVDMYAKCGALYKAQQLVTELPIRNVVTWNALIAGFAQQGQGKEALDCFEWMQCEGLSPNTVSFICILKACGSIKALEKGKQIHEKIVSQGLLLKDTLLATALVDMYARCGALTKAQQLVYELCVRDVVAWNALLTGYAEQGQGKETLNCFEQMERDGLSPDAVTFICILKACGSLGLADKGMQIHIEIISRRGLLGKDISLGTALVDMYAKCGLLLEASEVLNELPVRNVVPWNALIDGYAQQGQGEEALNGFVRLQHEGLSPDAVTFTCLLNACSRSGLVDESQMYMAIMCNNYGIKPGSEHYTFMVDLFGRAGHFDKALAVIKKMPSFDDYRLWSALLAACVTWGNLKLGRWAFDHAVQADTNGGGAHEHLDSYAAASQQKDVENRTS